MAEDLDPKISRRYRELGDEEPPRELDQAILAAAHRAADRAHAPLVAPAGRHRWYFAFGAAAILVLAVAITVQVDRQQLDPEGLPAASAPAVSERKEGSSSVPGEKKGDARVELRQSAEQAKPQPGLIGDQAPAQETRRRSAQAPAPAKSQPAENAAKPQAAEEARADRLEAQPQGALQENREQSRGLSSAGEPPAATPQPARPAAAPTPQARSQDERAVLSSALALPPERLLERVAELRKEGRHDEADKALAEFRQRYPDYRISEEMLKKVERPK
jgi:hypothetical protein